MAYPYKRVIPPHVWKGKQTKGAYRYDVTPDGKCIPRVKTSLPVDTKKQ